MGLGSASSDQAMPLTQMPPLGQRARGDGWEAASQAGLVAPGK